MISIGVPRASPGKPFLNLALTSPFFPCNATIFPRILRSPAGHATFRPMSRAASLEDLISGN